MNSFYNEKKTIHRSIIEKQLMRNWKPDAHLYGISVSMTHKYTRTCIYIYKPSRSIFHQPCTERGWACWKEENVKWTRVGSHPRTILWFSSDNNRVCVIGFASASSTVARFGFTSTCNFVRHLRTSRISLRALHEERQEDIARRAAAVAVPYRPR